MNARIVIGLLSVMVFVQFLVILMDDHYQSDKNSPKGRY